jgi:hypothetical protein
VPLLVNFITFFEHLPQQSLRVRHYGPELEALEQLAVAAQPLMSA